MGSSTKRAAKRSGQVPSQGSGEEGRAEEPGETVTCPACGGSGGGPFGPAGSAWDVEDYVCSRCKGRGVVEKPKPSRAPGPGVVKTTPSVPEAPAKKKKRASRG